jgi:DNA-binding transcriptional regulator YdaS (Cro superfamily)
MKKLLDYLNAMDPAEQQQFAKRCGTSVGYIRKAASIGQKLGESLSIAIDRETSGEVTCEELRPDVDWAYLRGSRKLRKTA